MKTRSPSLYRTSVAALMIAATALLASCKKQDDSEATVEVAVYAEHPRVGDSSEKFTADAILAPLAQAAISPKITSPVRAFLVQRGDRVHKGQVLATLEAGDLAGSAMDSQGNLTSAEAAYDTAVRATIPEEDQRAKLEANQAKASLEVATRTAEERKRLLESGAIAGREADVSIAAEVQAQAAYDVAAKHLQSLDETIRAANLKAAQGQLASARGRSLAARAQVGYASLRSPIDGVVSDRPLFAGETAASGSALLTIMDTSSLLAKLHLAQSVAQKLKPGGSAEVQVPGVEEPVRATVSFLGPALDPGSTTVEVWLKLPNRDGSLKVGTPVRVVIAGKTISDTLKIPAASLLPSPDESSGHVVMVVGTDGAAHRRSVTLGIRTDEDVQILDGLTPADNVITEGSYGLDEGTKVTLTKAKPDQDAAKQAVQVQQ